MSQGESFVTSKRDALVVLLDNDRHGHLNGHGVGLGHMDGHWVWIRYFDWDLDWVGNWLLNWVGHRFLNGHGVGFGHMYWVGSVDGHRHLHGHWIRNVFLDGHRVRMRNGHLHFFGDHNGLMMALMAPVRAKALEAATVETFVTEGPMAKRAVAQPQTQASFVFVACRWGLVVGRVNQRHDDTNNDL